MRRALFLGTSANLVGKIWIVISQLISIPVLMSSFGKEGFGVWVMLSTLPTYLALSDIGLSAAAAVEVRKATSLRNYALAGRVYCTVWTVLTSLSAVIGAAFYFVSLPIMGYSESIDAHVGSLWRTLLVVAAYAFFILQSQFFSAGIRATDRYAKGTVLMDLCTFLETLLVVLVAAMAGSIFLCFLAALIFRVCISFFLYIVLTAGHSWMSLRLQFPNIKELQGLLHPSLGSFTLVVASGIGIQGIVVSLGACFGPGAAAAYSVTRTVTRIPHQLSSLFARASIPEFTRTYTLGRTDVFRRLIVWNYLVCAAVLGLSGVFLFTFGDYVVHKLSSGQVVTEPLVLYALILAAVFNGFWYVAASPLVSLNNYRIYPVVYLGLSILLVCFPVVFRSEPTTFGLRFVSILTACVELATLISVLYSVGRLLRKRR